MRENQPTILMYGHDENLLITRQWVLQSRGYRVITMLDLAGFASLPLSTPVRLLLLCHSLSEEDANAAIAAASLRWPEIQSLELEGGSGRTPTGLLGQLLHTKDGPGKLLNVVGKMLGGEAHPPVPAHH